MKRDLRISFFYIKLFIKIFVFSKKVKQTIYIYLKVGDYNE
jgi:hypothetical protein